MPKIDKDQSVDVGNIVSKKVIINEEITPAHLRCGYGTCPAVYALSDGDVLIIGKTLPSELHAEIASKIGDDELAIRLSPDFFSNLDLSAGTTK